MSGAGDRPGPDDVVDHAIRQARHRAMIAYLLVQTTTGAAPRVAECLRATPTVESVDVVTGAFDLVARVRSEDSPGEVTRIVRQLRSLNGVLHVLSCPIGWNRQPATMAASLTGPQQGPLARGSVIRTEGPRPSQELPVTAD
jgi:hypothetical protein